MKDRFVSFKEGLYGLVIQVVETEDRQRVSANTVSALVCVSVGVKNNTEYCIGLNFLGREDGDGAMG